jgi:hypothetical protein
MLSAIILDTSTCSLSLTRLNVYEDFRLPLVSIDLHEMLHVLLDVPHIITD